MASETSARRVRAPRGDFLGYRTSCPYCGATVGPRQVTREHLDVPPDPPYAASVRCGKCAEGFEVIFDR